MKKKLKIFLIEGDIQARIAYERRLERLGHEVIVAKSGEQAVNIYEEAEKFDAIICGVEMRPGDGIFFLDYLRHTVLDVAELPQILVHNSARFYHTQKLVLNMSLLFDLPTDIKKLIAHAEFRQKGRDDQYLETFLDRVAKEKATI